MSKDGLQSLRQFVTECKDVFRLKLGADPPAYVKPLFLSHDEFMILSDHLNLTYIYNPLSLDPSLARHVVKKLQSWALKMSVFSNRMEHFMGELNYWTDLMTRWRVGRIAGSERKAHGKMASLF
jgi:hypothetical protein